MRKSINNKYYSIIGKYINDVQIDKLEEFIQSISSTKESDILSLYSLISHFDDAHLMTLVMTKFTFSNPENIKKLVRELLREYRKTLHYPKNAFLVILRFYPNALSYVIETITEVYGNNFIANTMNFQSSMKKHQDLLMDMAMMSDDVNFPLRSRPISQISNCFYISKDDSEALDVLQIEYSEVREVELCIYLYIKKSEGLRFSDILELEDGSVIKHKSFIYSALYVFNKTPYDLLNAKSDWVKENAMSIISN